MELEIAKQNRKMAADHHICYGPHHFDVAHAAVLQELQR